MVASDIEDLIAQYEAQATSGSSDGSGSDGSGTGS